MGEAVDDNSSLPAGEEKPAERPEDSAAPDERPEPISGEKSEKESHEADEQEAKEEVNKGGEEDQQEKTEAALVEGEKRAGENEELTGDQNSEAGGSVSTMRIPQNDSQAMEDEDPSYAALRGKANTPASVFTEPADGRDIRTGPRFFRWEWYAAMRPSAGARSQETFYRTAVDLLSARCTSSPKMVSTEPLMGVKDPPPGFGAPRVFYIHQRRPRPMTPLKVWRGYHGNVYFEPMKINQASLQEHQMEVHLPPMSRCSEKLQSVISQTRWNPEHVVRYRQNRHMLTPIVQPIPPSVRYKNQTQPVLVMDREALGRDPANQEVLRTLESTGTLRVQSSAVDSSSGGGGSGDGATSPSNGRQSGQRPDKSKLCKGSVARKLVMFRNLMVPLMQEQMAKNAQVGVGPVSTDAPAVELAPPRETPIKLPSISSHAPDRGRLRAK